MRVFALMRRYPLAAYFLLAFGISWGGVLVAVGPEGFPAKPDSFLGLLPGVVAAMLAGPSLGGILTVWLVEGPAGLRALASRARSLPADLRWYATLVIAPAASAGVLLALSVFSAAYVPGVLAAEDKLQHVLIGLLTGVCAGLFEEIGWTGFAIPRMRKRFGVLATGLLMGIIWGLWHLLTNLWGAGMSVGDVSMAVYVPVMLFAFLVPYRVLMVWAYERTRSLGLAMLMHASLTGAVRVFDPLVLTRERAIIYNLAFGAVLWCAVAAIAAADGGRLSRRSADDGT